MLFGAVACESSRIYVFVLYLSNIMLVSFKYHALNTFKLLIISVLLFVYLECLADICSKFQSNIKNMEEKVLKEIEALKSLTLLAAKNTLTLEDVSLLYGFSKSTLYKLTSAKAIPHYRRGKVLFFDKAELDAWAKECRVNTMAEAQQAALAYCLERK